MPIRSLKPCARAGCTKLTRGRYCPPCLSRRQRELDEQRGSAAERGYGGKWRRLRALILKRDPTCRCEVDECHHDPGYCGKRSSHVDHMVAKRDGGTDDPSNLKGLCGTCHNSAKQRTEKGG